MNFLEDIFTRLESSDDRLVLGELREGRVLGVGAGELLQLVGGAREALARAGLKPGDRIAVLAPNSIPWVALDLAALAEGLVVVPLYARQAPAELAGILKDARPALLVCADVALRDSISAVLPGGPPAKLFDEIFSADAAAPRSAAIRPRPARDPVAILYTSGTSGEPKGVVLTTENVTFMLGATNARLDRLMGPRDEDEDDADRVFHYLPFCFAGSWILLLTCLTRSSFLKLSTDLAKLTGEIRLAAPHYFLNVPTLLERMRSRIEEQIHRRGGAAARIFRNAWRGWLRRSEHAGKPADAIWLALARALVFGKIRAALGPNLRALICGSAPLAPETQLFFAMLDIPVLQVYGLTETTAICTMDDPGHVLPGRVGPAIPGIEMKLGTNDEILVRGPNLFPGYWERPEATAAVLRDGWFHTGDQGDADARGNWRITGRIKDLIILNSGHNVAPEPVETALARLLPAAQQVMLVGNARSFLCALITGEVREAEAQAALDRLNAGLPHYKQVRGFFLQREAFTPDSGLVTANGKLRRDAVAARLAREIDALYAEQKLRAGQG